MIYCTCEKTVALKVSETGQSRIHLDDAEHDEPLCVEPATDDHQLSTLKDAENWSSHPDEASSSGSCIQEMTVVDRVVMNGESDHRSDVLDTDSADAEPSAVRAQESHGARTEHKEMWTSAEVVKNTSDMESHINRAAKIEMDTTALASAEQTAFVADNCDVLTSRFNVDGSSVAVSAAVYSPVSDSSADADTAADNSSYRDEDEACTVDSISDMNISHVEALRHLTASDQHVQEGVVVDDAEEVDVRSSTGVGSFDELEHSPAGADRSYLPCVHTAVFESELYSANECSSGLPSHGGCEEKVKVCCACVCVVCVETRHGSCMSCRCDLAIFVLL